MAMARKSNPCQKKKKKKIKTLKKHLTKENLYDII